MIEVTVGRLSNEEVEQIKQDVSLVDLLNAQGYQLIKHGQQVAINCPFHDDKTPSLIITPNTNLWHCKGCGVGGDNITWVMKTQGVSFRFACEILQKDLGVLRGAGAQKVKKNSTLTMPSFLAADSERDAALLQVVNYYHETLKQSPEALAYLEKRGLVHPELIDHFQLGFANRTLGYRLPKMNVKAGKEQRSKLQDIGLLRSSGHEHFTGCLVVPIFNEQGVVTQAYGRKILGNSLRKGTPQHLYLPGPHQSVWNIEALKAAKEVILCESLIDAMTFWVSGFRNVITSYGTAGFTAAHLAALKQYKTERVLIAYDRDEAGNLAAETLSEKLQAEDIASYRILLPKNMDVNEYALVTKPTEKSLGLAIRQAQWLSGSKPENSPEAEPTLVEPELKPSIPATPLPEAAKPVEAQINNDEITMAFGERNYRIRGFEQNRGDQLKLSLLLNHPNGFHLDKLDLYSSKQRTTFINQASAELCLQEEVIKKDLGKILFTVEQALEEKKQQPEPIKQLTNQEHDEALALLTDKSLLQRILTDFDRLGIVGEQDNKLVGYLSCVSRLLDKPIALVIQSSSAAGKSSLMETILTMMPVDDRIQYSAMTGQSLYYMGLKDLKHKILAIAEEEGARNASYALKLLQSEGEVRIASTGKDESTGDLVTKEYCAEGPVMLFMTTTAIDIDEELMNRCLVLSVDESREQTRAIHQAQRRRRTLEGLEDKLNREAIVDQHRNAQSLLKRLMVINPYADQLTFMDDKTRMRRDHEKYLTLIDSIALLHQHQRPIKTLEQNGQALSYVEVTIEDIKVANQLAHGVLGHSLDELPPQTRKLLWLLQHMVHTICETQAIDPHHYRFSRKQVREACGWSYTQVKVHLDRLVEMEYVLAHRGSQGRLFEYELFYQGEAEHHNRFLMGLIDVESLCTTKTSRGKNSTSRSDKATSRAVHAPLTAH